MFVFLGKKHKATLLIKWHRCGICVNSDESASTSAHCGKNMLDLKKNRSAYLLPGIVFRYGKTTDFNSRILFASLGVGDTAV